MAGGSETLGARSESVDRRQRDGVQRIRQIDAEIELNPPERHPQAGRQVELVVPRRQHCAQLVIAARLTEPMRRIAPHAEAQGGDGIAPF